MKKVLIPLIALLTFSAFTLYVMATADQSLIQFGLQLLSSPDTAQVVFDLYIIAALACIWMYRDARARGKSLGYVLPYLLVTAVFVSIGPLLYIVTKGLSKPGAAVNTPQDGETASLR